MVVPVNPGNKIDAHVARVRDEWSGGGGGSGVQDVRIVDQPVMTQTIGIQTVSIGNYPIPLLVDIFSVNTVVPVRTDQPTILGGYDLSAANPGPNWVRFDQITNRWRGGSPDAHGVFACVRHQNMIGGNVEIRLVIELPSSFQLESMIVVPTSPHDQFIAFPAPVIVGAPPAWQEQLLPFFWQTAWLEVRVPSGYSTGDLYLVFSHSVES